MDAKGYFIALNAGEAWEHVEALLELEIDKYRDELESRFTDDAKDTRWLQGAIEALRNVRDIETINGWNQSIQERKTR